MYNNKILHYTTVKSSEKLQKVFQVADSTTTLLTPFDLRSIISCNVAIIHPIEDRYQCCLMMMIIRTIL